MTVRGWTADRAAGVARRSSIGLSYLVLAVLVDVAGAVAVLAGGLLSVVLLITPLGAWLLAFVLRSAARLAALRRATAGRMLGEWVQAPPGPTGGGLFDRRRAVLANPANWRALSYLVVKLPASVLLLVVGSAGYVYGAVFLTYPLQRQQFSPWAVTIAGWILGVSLILVAPWLLSIALAADRSLIRVFLGANPTERQLADLRETRDLAVAGADATLRRIERDLHDGAQAHLVGVGMHLTMVRELLTTQAPPDQVRAAVDTAQDALTAALAELRNLVRGIHPPVLDSGLEAALRSVAAASPVPVTVSADLPRRPPPALESIVYFCACELLTNISRHSTAASATVEVADHDGVLRLCVRDNGRGGAYLRDGGGLAGLAERARTVDGRLSIDSPPAGPTVVTVDIPGPPAGWKVG